MNGNPFITLQRPDVLCIKTLTTSHAFLQSSFVEQRVIAQFWIILPLQSDLPFCLLKLSLIRSSLNDASPRCKAEDCDGKDSVE